MEPVKKGYDNNMFRAKINRRQLHHYYRQVKFIRPRYFLLIALIFFGMAVYGLRQNNLKMVELREAVIAADKRDGDIETALSNLRNYVYSHMNTDLSSGQFAINPPIQLKAKYERLIAEQKKNLDKANERVEEQAKAVCVAEHPGEGYNSPRVACVQKYVQQNASQVGDVSEDLYKFDFVSPKWTLDFAGITLILGMLFSGLFLVWLVLERWVRSKVD